MEARERETPPSPLASPHPHRVTYDTHIPHSQPAHRPNFYFFPFDIVGKNLAKRKQFEYKYKQKSVRVGGDMIVCLSSTHCMFELL